jgi:limonene-1,2-epoxide hydrolase
MNLTELIEDFTEFEVYDEQVQDWRDYLETDDFYVPDHELVY